MKITLYYFIMYFYCIFVARKNNLAMANIQETGNEGLTFEDFKNENGITYWWASDMMKMLGYPNIKSFQKVLDRATKAFVSLGIPHYENIIPEQRVLNDTLGQDFKLTRFACYMSAMNADPKKQEVAIAQAYFAQQARKFELHVAGHQDIDRMLIREELVEGNKSLSSTAKRAGVSDFAKFANAGYLGLYNMPSWKLEKRRYLKKGKLLDNMGRTELAANLFRVTQTEERIKSRGIRGQVALEQTHTQVGKEVRAMVVDNTGMTPENLPQAKELPQVKKELKKANREMKKEDKAKKKKK
ncbi:MAG: damage-inducible protein [Bacteroidales bacterium]